MFWSPEEVVDIITQLNFFLLLYLFKYFEGFLNCSQSVKLELIPEEVLQICFSSLSEINVSST